MAMKASGRIRESAESSNPSDLVGVGVMYVEDSEDINRFRLISP
jgi:hypothetical protein